MFLSIIIPAYNEEQRIGKTLFTMKEYFKSQNYDYEVIVVDDGSRDDTVLKSQESSLALDGKLKVVKNGINRGKGFSVKNGILNSSGEYILISDADMSTPIQEVEKLLKHIKDGNDVVIGSRSIQGSDIRVYQPWYRQIMGKTFNLFVKTLLFRGINDTQCGFKLFRGDVARNIAQKMRIEGFCFDVEMLYLAKKSGFKVKEIGVVWENSPDSRVTVVNSSLNMFFDLFKIKKIHR